MSLEDPSFARGERHDLTPSFAAYDAGHMAARRDGSKRANRRAGEEDSRKRISGPTGNSELQLQLLLSEVRLIMSHQFHGIAVCLCLLPLLAACNNAMTRETVAHRLHPRDPRLGCRLCGLPRRPGRSSSSSKLTICALRAPLNTSQNAQYISGNNHSDDLWMYVQGSKWRGLTPIDATRCAFEVEIATTYANVMRRRRRTSPGEGVTVKAGASTSEPERHRTSAGAGA